MKNESFDIERFGALFVRYWAERKVQILLYNLLSVLLLFWLLISEQQNYKQGHLVQINVDLFAIFWGTAIYMMLHMSLAFKDISNRKSGALFTVIPATSREKFVYFLIIGLVAPLVIYMTLVGTIDWAIFDYLYPQNKMLLLANLKGDDVYPLMVELFYIILLFLGFFAFRKHHLIYSVTGVVLALGFGIVWLEGLLSRMIIYPRIVAGSPMGSFQVGGFGPYVLTSDYGLIFDYPYYSWGFIALFISLVIYGANLKFREKQFKV